MDKREYVQDQEEAIRTVFEGLMRGHAKVMPCLMSADTADGHSCEPQPSIQRSVTDPVSGLQSFLDHPIAVDVPIHYAGGKKVVATHPVGKGDEGIILYADRAIDAVRQQGGTAQPIDNRQHHLGDGLYIPGIRTDPRKLMQVDNDAHHVRSVDKLHVKETHPDKGHRTFSADPSTAPASASFDPLTMASKFVDHAVQGAKGLLARAVSGGTTHDHGIDFGSGPFMRAANAIHSVLCHAQNGPSMNAQNLLHQVMASPALGAVLSSLGGKHTVATTTGGVMIASATAVGISAPPGGLSLSGLAGGSISGGALAPGAASQNVGSVGGDLGGNLPNPQVVGIGNVDATNLPRAASDSVAANAGVALNHLYVNTGAVSGVGLLAVRLA